MFQICVQFLDDGAMYRDSIALVMNYVWLFIAAISSQPPPLYVMLWYGHLDLFIWTDDLRKLVSLGEECIYMELIT